jgi:hypothetical protein
MVKNNRDSDHFFMVKIIGTAPISSFCSVWKPIADPIAVGRGFTRLVRRDHAGSSDEMCIQMRGRACGVQTCFSITEASTPSLTTSKRSEHRSGLRHRNRSQG